MVQKQARRRYTIAWICPLIVEYDAARQMLDENHGIPSYLSTGSNAYTLGSIHGHNVVLLMPGEAGSVPAAYAVARMRKAFPELEHGLLVGIGGGVPVKTDNGDIRLGDVVVGTPAGVHPGTVRYDQGKAGTEGLTRTGCLSRPPALLLTAARRLAAIRLAEDIPDPICRNLRRLEGRGPTQERLHPGNGHDRLYAPDYNHVASGVPCTDCGCDPGRLVHRAQRDDGEESSYSPVVHGATIATGEMIIKDAAARDQLAQEFGAVCFETEAAGVLYDFPCLVIRGISDYCDSHKDRQWHKYAAATAAAYARALLEQVPYQGAKRSPDDEIIERKQRLLIATWMSPMIYERQQQHLRSMHMKRTGLWLLEDKKFTEWLDLDKQKRTLLFSGGAGVGKTVMVSSVIQHLQATFSAEPLVATAYVYCDGRKAEQSPLKLLLCLSKQLYAGLDFTPDSISELHRQCVEKQKLPKYGQVVRALTLLSNLYERVFIIVDAVDEIFDAEKAENFLATLADIQANANVNILLTWREIPNIEHVFDNVARIEIRASKSDLEEYLGRRIDRVSFLSGDAPAQQQVKTSLLRVLEKTPRFLLAYLYTELLQGCSSVTEVTDILKETTNPDEYHDIYTKIMEKIEKKSGDKRQIGICVLAWLSCAMGCLTLPELQYAITLQAERAGINLPMIKDSTFIVSACLGLVTVNPVDDAVQLVHATAYDYLHQAQAELESAAHCDISQTCMEYLSNRGRCPEKPAGTERFSPGLFHEYAAQNWGHHARMSSVSLTNAVVKFMADENLVREISQHIFALQVDHEPSQVQATGMTNIHLAAYFGLHDSLQVMIEARENLPWYQRVMNRLFRGPLGLDSKDTCGRTPLSYAAEKGTPATIKLLIGKGATADLRDRAGRTPLSWAAESNNHAALSELLGPADIDAKDNFGRIPLSWAAGNGCFEAVEKLMEARTADRSGTLQGLAAEFEFLWADKPSLSEDEPSGATPLIWASSNGHLRVVKYLLDNNVTVERKDLNGRAALSWAAGNGHAALVQNLLRWGSDPNATDKRKKDALMWAAAHGHLTVASYLLQSAACFKARDVTGRTALSLAAENGQNALVALLLERGAPPDDQDDEGRTPLSWAAEGGHRTASKSLLDHHAALDLRDKNGRTALSWAAGRGQVKAVELLINQGANLELPDHSGRNALSWAAGNGQTEMVVFLVDIANPSLLTATDTSGMTFFLWAARNGHNRIVSLLLDQLEYDLIHTPTKKGENAFFVACQYGRTEVVKTFLRENCFSKYESDHRGLTSLMVAVLEEKFEIADLLLKNGAPVNALDAEMQTVLHHAAYRGSLRFARLFLKHGASLEIQDNFGRSPLLVAAEENSEAIAGLLLTRGAHVDCQDHDGQTPLHWAVKHNNVRMAHSLLRRGANVGITNKQGLTPEAQARRLGGNQGGELRRLFWSNSYRRARAWSSSTESLSSVNSR